MFSFVSPKNFLKFSQETKIPKINFMWYKINFIFIPNSIQKRRQ